MEHKYLNSWIGKAHAFIVVPFMALALYEIGMEYAGGKNANLWGIPVMILGFISFLKAKWSVIKNKKLVSFGCDPMTQKNTYFYFLGWVLMITGYIISWR